MQFFSENVTVPRPIFSCQWINAASTCRSPREQMKPSLVDSFWSLPTELLPLRSHCTHTDTTKMEIHKEEDQEALWPLDLHGRDSGIARSSYERESPVRCMRQTYVPYKWWISLPDSDRQRKSGRERETCAVERFRKTPMKCENHSSAKNIPDADLSEKLPRNGISPASFLSATVGLKINPVAWQRWKMWHSLNKDYTTQRRRTRPW